MAEQSQSEFMDNNNPYTSLPTRQPNESLYAYLLRLAQARGGMMLGEYSPSVDDVVAEEITTQPLGVLIKQDSGDGGDDNNRDTRTPEERQRDMMERAVGLLSGEAASAAGLGSIAGPAGILFGAFADYDTISQFENQLEKQGYTPEQIEAIKDNPSMLQQGLQTGQFGVVSKGYEPTIVDKLSMTSIFSDILGSDDGYSGPQVPGITGLANINASRPTYAGAVDYSQPFSYQGLLSGSQPFNVTPGFGTVLAPTAGVVAGYAAPSIGAGLLSSSNYSPIGTQQYGGNVVGTTATGGLLVDRTGDGIADVRTGVSPNTGQVNTYNFNLGDNNSGSSSNGSSGSGGDRDASGDTSGGYGSDPSGGASGSPF